MPREVKDQWQTALKLLAEMRAHGIQPNAIAYTAAISACEKSKDQWQTALKLLDEMQVHGIQPNVITYTAYISACERLKDQWHMKAAAPKAASVLSYWHLRGLKV